MNGGFDFTTLIFLVVALAIVWRLRSVLGSRTGHERPPNEPYQRSSAQKNEDDSAYGERDNVVPLPGARQGEHMTDAGNVEVMEAKVRNYAADGSRLEQNLVAIFRSDNRFEPGTFLEGAKTAYEMIVMAFAEGNKQMLKKLLSREVFEGFSAAISEREKVGQFVESSFVGIDKADIVDAELKNKTARVTVKFVSSLITATRNADGKVIDGDPKKVVDVTDIWTFAREVTAGNPNWKLIATEGAV